MAEADATSTEKPKKKTLGAKIVEALFVTLVAGGAGAALAAFTPQPAPENPTGAILSHTGDATVACGSGSTNIVDIPPIVTNIGAPADTWVRLEASIVFDGKSLAHPEIVAAEIAADELAYLRTVSVSQLQGPVGLENIRQDLTDRAVTRSGGKVTELLLKTLVLQ